MITLADLCAELRNWFCWDEDKHFGVSLSDISGLGIKENQYFRVMDSIFNDGVYKYPKDDFVSEDTKFTVWVMRVPSQVLDLLDAMNTWETKYTDSVEGPYQSESFDGYSRTLRSSGDSSGSAPRAWSWRDQFRSQLDQWRKV